MLHPIWCRSLAIIDHESDLSSLQESIVLLCHFLFHEDSPLEVSGQQIILANIEFDDLNSSTLLAESTSLIHAKASVGTLELERTSLSKFIFQITNVVAFGNSSNSLLSASFLFGTSEDDDTDGTVGTLCGENIAGTEPLVC